VWLYADDRSGRVLGIHPWPEAIRRPIASVPRADYHPDALVHPEDAGPHLDIALPLPEHRNYFCPLIVCHSRTHAMLLLVRELIPEPVNEMLLYEQEGLKGIFRLARDTQLPDSVGQAAAKIELSPPETGMVIQNSLESEIQQDIRFGMSFVNAMYQQHGDGWIKDTVARNDIQWTATNHANFALGLPPSPSVWELVEGWGGDAEHRYWQQLYPRYGCIEHWPTILEKWKVVKRPWSTIELLSNAIDRRRNADAPKPSVDHVIEALESALQIDTEATSHDRTNQLTSHYVEKLFEYLDEEQANRDHIARLEWGWLRLLQHSKRGIRALQEAVTSSPEVFVDLLKSMFRAEGEETKVDPDRASMADQAYHLLQEIKVIPGQKPDGTVVAEELREWVLKARELASEAKRLGVCDSQIGQILSYSPPSADDSWPCREVRDLLEEIQSSRIERGMEIGKLNQRGVVTRGKGGRQEWKLAEEFRQLADQVRTEWPRSGAVLDSIAEHYEYEAKKWDEAAKWDEYQ
jgi:hypothetical protein